MNKHIFTGAGVALITPMHSDGSVNYEELAREAVTFIDNVEATGRLYDAVPLTP